MHTPCRIARGELLLRLIDVDGRVVEETLQRNSFTNAYAAYWAKVLANTNTLPLALSHIGLGAAGVQITTAESATGWASAPTLDTTTFREGAASLKGTSPASTSTAYVHTSLISATNLSATGMSIELQLRLLTRANLNLSTSELRIYSGATDYFKVSLATVESIAGVFVDAIWKLCRIPTSAFVVGSGSPVWTGITGMGVYVSASASGTATVNWDDVRSYPTTIDTSAAATVVPNERAKSTLTSLEDLGSGQVRARVFWPTVAAVGTYYVAGLYGNAGGTLAAIVPITLSKTSTLSLTAEWTVTASGA